MSDQKIKQVGPWLQFATRQVYDNPWITVHHDQVKTPAGTDGIYGRIHFKNVAIGIIPIDQQGNTWLVGQYRYALDAYSWEIPMGGGQIGQDPLVCAQRELKEETGFSAASWQNIMTLHTSNSVTDELAYVFLARELTAGESSLEDTESDLVVKKLPFAQAVNKVTSGELTDAISVAGLLAVERLLRQTSS